MAQEHCVCFAMAINVVDTACTDTNGSCPEWAKKGECQKNPNYMLGNCAKSCHHCECGDNDVKCDEWAGKGQCALNPNFMKVQCRQACKICKSNQKVHQKDDVDKSKDFTGYLRDMFPDVYGIAIEPMAA